MGKRGWHWYRGGDGPYLKLNQSWFSCAFARSLRSSSVRKGIDLSQGERTLPGLTRSSEIDNGRGLVLLPMRESEGPVEVLTVQGFV